MGWNGKGGKGKQILKGGGQLFQGVSALKSGGWNPLTNYVYIIYIQWCNLTFWALTQSAE